MSDARRGLGRIYKRPNSGVWWIDYSFRGKRYRESSGSTRRSDAKALLRKRLEEMGRGRLIGPNAENVTLCDLCRLLLDDYRVNGRKSIKRAELSANTLKGYFGDHTRALDLTTDRVNAYISSRLENDGVKPATVQKELAALKRAFNLAVQAGLLDQVPHIPNLQLRNTRTGFFEPADFEAVLQELPEYLRPPMRFGYLTGWRVLSEVLPLTWAQVDFEAGLVRLEPGTTKNDEGRTFPFAALPEFEALLRRQRERTSALEKATACLVPWVFHNDGERIRHYKTAWHSACVSAGVGRWKDPANRRGYVGPVVHDLRRTAVRNLVRAGVPEIVAMRLCGHKTRAIFDRYSVVNEAMLKDAVEKLARLHESAERKVVRLDERGKQTLRHISGTVSGSEPRTAVGSES
jgi:integrase